MSVSASKGKSKRIIPLSEFKLHTLERRVLLSGVSWSPGVSLPAGRAGASVYNDGSSIYLLGGTVASGATSSVLGLSYDASAWTSAPSLDRARSGGIVGLTGQPGPLRNGGGGYKYLTDVFDYGGLTTSQTTFTDVNYDPYPDGENTTSAAMSVSRRKFAGATDPTTGDLYAIGGINSSGTALASVERYDPVTDAWSTVAPLPAARYALSAVYDGAGHVFAFGGDNNVGAPMSTTYRYTIATNTWDTAASMPVATSDTTAVFAFYGEIYVLGGKTSTAATASVESFDAVNNNWAIENSLSAPVYDAAAVIDPDGNLQVIGGYASNGSLSSAVSVSPVTPPVQTLAQLPQITFNGYSVFNCSPQPVTATAVGTDGVTPVDGTFTFIYNNSGTPPTAAGTYSVLAYFTSNDPGYVSTIVGGSEEIDPATPSIVLQGGGTIDYDGNAHPITAVVSGVDGITPVSGTTAYTYNGTNTQPVAPGSYTAVATFTSSDPNYTDVSATTTVTIPDPTIPVNVKAVGYTTSSILLSWDPVADAGSYNVYKKQVTHDAKGSGSTITYPLIASGITGNSAIIPLSSGTFYVSSVDAVTGVVSTKSVGVTGAALSPAYLWGELLTSAGAVVGSGTVEVGQILTMTVLASGNLYPTFSILSGPSTMTIDPVTGVLTYTPVASEVGTQMVTFQGANSTGTSTTTLPFYVLAKPTIVVTGGTFGFDDTAHAATAVAYASDGVTPLSGTFSFSYNGSVMAGATDPGSYAVVATFTSSDPTYGGGTATTTIDIGQIVTNTADSGPGSLSQALIDATTVGQTVVFAQGLAGTINVTGQFAVEGNTITNPTRLIIGDGTNLNIQNLNLSSPYSDLVIENGDSAQFSNSVIAGQVDDAGNLSIDNSQQLRAVNIGPTGVLTFATSATSFAVRADSLSIASGGTVDIENNGLVLTSATLSTIDEYLAAGLSGGTTPWNGPGIQSLYSAGDSLHRLAIAALINQAEGSALYNTLDGLPINTGDILIAPTYFGDATFNGAVDGSDYSRIDSGLLTGSPGWYNGDFNYDGIINGSDYTLIDNAFNQQGSKLNAGATAQVAPNTFVAAIVATSDSDQIKKHRYLLNAVLADR